MIVDMSNFGEMLMSRSSGREDFLKAKAYIFDESKDTDIMLDFAKVKVLTPSWADEFISGLKSQDKYSVECINTTNPSVAAALQMVLNPIDVTQYEKVM